MGNTSYKSTVYASGEETGEMWLVGTKSLAPTVWRVNWPKEIRDELITQDTQMGSSQTPILKC